MTRTQRLQFARGYADAWAKRPAKETGREYRRGYAEGEDDRKRGSQKIRAKGKAQ